MTPLLWKRELVVLHFFSVCLGVFVLPLSVIDRLFSLLLALPGYKIYTILRPPPACMHPVSILHKSIAGSYRPVRIADGPITARYRFIKNVNWAITVSFQ